MFSLCDSFSASSAGTKTFEARAIRQAHVPLTLDFDILGGLGKKLRKHT